MKTIMKSVLRRCKLEENTLFMWEFLLEQLHQPKRNSLVVILIKRKTERLAGKRKTFIYFFCLCLIRKISWLASFSQWRTKSNCVFLLCFLIQKSSFVTWLPLFTRKLFFLGISEYAIFAVSITLFNYFFAETREILDSLLYFMPLL